MNPVELFSHLFFLRLYKVTQEHFHRINLIISSHSLKNCSGTRVEEEEEVSEKPLLNDFEDSTSSRPFYQPNQVIVKSVLRKKRNASVSSTRSHTPRRRYNVLLFGDNLTAGKIFNWNYFSILDFLRDSGGLIRVIDI